MRRRGSLWAWLAVLGSPALSACSDGPVPAAPTALPKASRSSRPRVARPQPALSAPASSPSAASSSASDAWRIPYVGKPGGNELAEHVEGGLSLAATVLATRWVGDDHGCPSHRETTLRLSLDTDPPQQLIIRGLLGGWKYHPIIKGGPDEAPKRVFTISFGDGPEGGSDVRGERERAGVVRVDVRSWHFQGRREPVRVAGRLRWPAERGFNLIPAVAEGAEESATEWQKRYPACDR